MCKTKLSYISLWQRMTIVSVIYYFLDKLQICLSNSFFEFIIFLFLFYGKCWIWLVFENNKGTRILFPVITECQHGRYLAYLDLHHKVRYYKFQVSLFRRFLGNESLVTKGTSCEIIIRNSIYIFSNSPAVLFNDLITIRIVRMF